MDTINLSKSFACCWDLERFSNCLKQLMGCNVQSSRLEHVFSQLTGDWMLNASRGFENILYSCAQQTQAIIHIMFPCCDFITGHGGELTAHVYNSLIFLCCFSYWISSCIYSCSGTLCCDAAETWINTYELHCSYWNSRLLQCCTSLEMYLAHSEKMEDGPVIEAGHVTQVVRITLC